MQLNVLLLIYVLNALVVASILILAFLSDRSTSKRQKMSWMIIGAAATFWFIAIPVSIVEVLHRIIRQRHVLQKPHKPSGNFS